MRYERTITSYNPSSMSKSAHASVKLSFTMDSPQKPAVPAYPSVSRTEHTISPHTTSCLKSPLLPFTVKNPSLPAINSLHSVASILAIRPASSICWAFSPKIIHFPRRALRSDSQRAGRWVGGGDWLAGGREERARVGYRRRCRCGRRPLRRAPKQRRRGKW